MSLLDVIEETCADCETTILYNGIQLEQRLAERVDLRQIGHLRTEPKSRQLLQQCRQFLAFGRVLAPAAQKIFGVQQDIHTLRQKQRDHAGVAWLAVLVFAALASIRQTSLIQCMHLRDEVVGTLDGRQRFTLKVLQPSPQQLFCSMQKFRFG